MDWGRFWPGPWPFRFIGDFVLSYLWFALGLVLDVMFGSGFVLSYRWFALCVGFGRSTFAAVSSYHIFGPPLVLVLDNWPPESVRSPFLAQPIGKNGVQFYPFIGSP